MTQINPIEPGKPDPSSSFSTGPTGDSKDFQPVNSLETQLISQYGPEGKKLYQMIMKSMAMMIVHQMQQNQKMLKKALQKMRKQQ